MLLKFRFVIIAFNVIIVLFLAFVFLIPFIVLGRDMAFSALPSMPSWFLAPVLVALLIGIDVYFALNNRVFTLLEKEDWPALVQELENRVIHKAAYSPRLVKLLANSYLVLSDAVSVNALEKKLAVAKPGLLNANALTFGAARILAKDNKGAVEFFGERLPGSGSKTRGLSPGDMEWLLWYYGFALLLDRQFDSAADRFSILAGESKDGIVSGLSTYFLDDTLKKFLPTRNLVITQAVIEGRERVRKALSHRGDWNREAKRLETEVHAAVLANYIGKAGDFIYAHV
jgi:hypothetical protein